VLAVLDDGPGVEQAQLEAIFSPWYRAPSTREHTSGSGLGLAIARRLALSIQGELHARNRADGGFEAALTLPFDKPSERDCICVRGP
jgi:signal transduction histidine kinase